MSFSFISEINAQLGSIAPAWAPQTIRPEGDKRIFHDDFDLPWEYWDNITRPMKWQTWYFYDIPNETISYDVCWARFFKGQDQQIYVDPYIQNLRPHSTANSTLTIQSRLQTISLDCEGKNETFPWYSGAISTTAADQFQLDTYFEMRMKFDPKPGQQTSALVNTLSQSINSVIEFVAYYGEGATYSIGIWVNATYSNYTSINTSSVGSPADSFHTYGALWRDGLVAWYFDREFVYWMPFSVPNNINQSFASTPKLWSQDYSAYDTQVDFVSVYNYPIPCGSVNATGEVLGCRGGSETYINQSLVVNQTTVIAGAVTVKGNVTFEQQATTTFFFPGSSLTAEDTAQLAGDLVINLEPDFTGSKITLVNGSAVTGQFSTIQVNQQGREECRPTGRGQVESGSSFGVLLNYPKCRKQDKTKTMTIAIASAVGGAVLLAIIAVMLGYAGNKLMARRKRKFGARADMFADPMALRANPL